MMHTFTKATLKSHKCLHSYALKDKHIDLTGSFSSRVSGSPAALLKLLVLEEEREISGLPLHSFSLREDLTEKERKNESVAIKSLHSASVTKLEMYLSLLTISGELGLDSDLTSCER